VGPWSRRLRMYLVEPVFATARDEAIVVSVPRLRG
jgi:hypothetical protein